MKNRNCYLKNEYRLICYDMAAKVMPINMKLKIMYEMCDSIDAMLIHS